MKAEQDAGRARHVLLTLVGGGVVAVVGGLYALYGYLSKPPPTPSRVDIQRVGQAVSASGGETPAYQALLREYNREGVEAARQRNSSFIASLPLAQTPVSTAPAAVKTPPPRDPVPPSAPDARQSEAARQRQDERQQQALTALLAKIGQGEATGLTVAQALGGPLQTASAPLQRASFSAETGVTPPATVEVVPPYWRGPGVIETGVDSDNGGTPVLGRFVSGPYAGAVLKAPAGAKLAGDGVVIHFTDMAWRGVNYQVDAYALQEDSLVANVATDVNHRYVSRIVLPALLKGIGGIGEMYAQANTQVVTNGFNTVTTRPGTPDGQAVAGAIAGGTASQAAKVLGSDAARLPATQVSVRKGQVVAIQFMRGVYASDAVTAGAPVPAPLTVVTPPPAQPVDWQAETQRRIEARRQQQATEITPGEREYE